MKKPNRKKRSKKPALATARRRRKTESTERQLVLPLPLTECAEGQTVDLVCQPQLAGRIVRLCIPSRFVGYIVERVSVDGVEALKHSVSAEVFSEVALGTLLNIPFKRGSRVVLSLTRPIAKVNAVFIVHVPIEPIKKAPSGLTRRGRLRRAVATARD